MWTVRLEGGPRRVNHAATAIDGKVYSFGGYCTGEDYDTRKPIDVHVLNTLSLRWTLLPLTQPHTDDVPFQRYGHTVVAYGGSAYLWGGRDNRGPCDVVYRFDTNTMTWSRPRVQGRVPGAHCGHSACVLGHRMYIFGGFEEDRFSQNVRSLDLETMQWQQVPTRGQPPQWRFFHSASPIGDRMYVWGGQGDEQGPYHIQVSFFNNRISFLDTATSCWVHPRTEGTPPAGRRSHSAFEYQGQLYIFGGYNELFGRHFGDVHKYDPENSSWTQVKVQREGPCARRRQCCCVVGDRLYLFGGRSPEPVQRSGQHVDEPATDEMAFIDHSDLHVLDFAPTLKTLCLVAVIDARLDINHLPQDIRSEISAMTTNNNISRPTLTTG